MNNINGQVSAAVIGLYKACREGATVNEAKKLDHQVEGGRNEYGYLNLHETGGKPRPRQMKWTWQWQWTACGPPETQIQAPLLLPLGLARRQA